MRKVLATSGLIMMYNLGLELESQASAYLLQQKFKTSILLLQKRSLVQHKLFLWFCLLFIILVNF